MIKMDAPVEDPLSIALMNWDQLELNITGDNNLSFSTSIPEEHRYYFN